MADKKPQVARLDASCVWSPEMDQAALDVLSALPDDRREYAGAIYQREGPAGLLEYCYSERVPGTNDNFAFASEQGRRLAGLWHTHPAGHDSDHFSPHDVKVAGALNKPSYILDQASQEVRRFDPATSATRAAPRNGRLEAGAKVSRGELVGTLTPDAQDRDARRRAITNAYEEAQRAQSTAQ